MDFDSSRMEKMAKEYRDALAAKGVTAATDGLAERALAIIEEQLDIINYMLPYVNNPQGERLLGYLKTLKGGSAVAVNKLLNVTEYVPSFRTVQKRHAHVYRLVDLQISLFVLLDGISKETSVFSLIEAENRAMSIMSLLIK